MGRYGHPLLAIFACLVFADRCSAQDAIQTFPASYEAVFPGASLWNESLCNTKADANTKLASLRDDIPWCAPTTPRDIQTCPPVPLRWA